MQVNLLAFAAPVKRKKGTGVESHGLRVQSGTVRPDDVVAIGQSELQLSVLGNASIDDANARRPEASSSPAQGGISQLTNERSIRGTLAFMAPEPIKESRAVGFPADLYATGGCLIRLLGGELPKPAFESSGRHVEEVLGSLDSVPNGLLRIIRKATAPVVPDRYATAETMAKDLYPFHQRRQQER